LSKTGQFQNNGGNKQRKNSHKRQENSVSAKPNHNGNSSSRKSNSRNTSSRKKAIHPWVSSGPASSQALTSHISMVNKNQSGNGGNTRNKPQGQKKRNASRQQRENTNKSSARNRSNFDRVKKSNGRNPSNMNLTEKKSYTPSNSENKLSGSLDAFSLFCAYHLGIGPNKEYKPSNINEVARRFGYDQGVIKQALKECNMDSASLLDKDFDMALAQLDIQVAPEGIDKIELAKSIYEDFLKAPNVKRDWKKIIEEDRKENRKIFG
tara:strand:+ start:568 stop:1362 length:795 start_codon:yes stop_codon:yes gene_type:complete